MQKTPVFTMYHTLNGSTQMCFMHFTYFIFLKKHELLPGLRKFCELLALTVYLLPYILAQK